VLIHDYLDFWCQRAPDQILMSDESGSISRFEFAARTRQIANLMADLVEPGARVAVIGKNSFDFLAIYFAASRSGVVPVPVNYRLAPPEWRFILEDAGTEVVIADVEFAAALDTVRDDLKTVTHFFGIDGEIEGWSSFDDAVNAMPDTPLAHRSTPDDLVYQMYTSGTTGLPKGAMLSQRAVVAHLQQLSAMVGLGENPCTLIAAPMYHAAGAVTVINAIA